MLGFLRYRVFRSVKCGLSPYLLIRLLMTL